MIGQRILPTALHRYGPDGLAPDDDWLAVEEPLEVRLTFTRDGARTTEPLAVTMRTPGHDVALALGFLYGEGLIDDFGAVDTLRHSGPTGGLRDSRNVLTVALRAEAAFDPDRLRRHFYTTSSCGVCGKASLEAIAVTGCPLLPSGTPRLHPDQIVALPEALRAAQDAFTRTGGLHAAALFDADGTLRLVREDVGRHNALDKVVGEQLLAGGLPLHGLVGLVSGRASFELVQKAVRAGLPVLAAVGAPSSLAVDLAREHGLTLLGFVRGGRFNVYHDAGRIGGLPAHLTG